MLKLLTVSYFITIAVSEIAAASDRNLCYQCSEELTDWNGRTQSQCLQAENIPKAKVCKKEDQCQTVAKYTNNSGKDNLISIQRSCVSGKQPKNGCVSSKKGTDNKNADVLTCTSTCDSSFCNDGIPNETNTSSGLSTGAIIGIVIGSVAGVAIIAVIIIFACKKDPKGEYAGANVDVQ